MLRQLTGGSPSEVRGGEVSAAARRNHPFNDPADGSDPAPIHSGQPQKAYAHAAAGRLCLFAVPHRRLGGFAESIEKFGCGALRPKPRRADGAIAAVGLFVAGAIAG
jgi:hypothetical protein